MHRIWLARRFSPSYVCLFFLQQRFVQSYAANLHLPQLSTKFEPWMKHLSVFDMKQQYILKLILLRGITLFSTGIMSWIILSCFIVDLLLYVAYLSSCFGNSKMVTECEPKPISMNFGSPRSREGEGFMCGRHGAGLDWPEWKTILATISNLFLLN